MPTITTRPDFDIIVRIAERAERECGMENYQNRLTTLLDLEYWHEAMPLNLQGLLDAKASDFAHDVFGIREHIDRETKKPDAFRIFVPRHARQQ